MLKCQEVAARASDLIDGNLGRWEALRLRLHLAMCRGCGRFVRQMRITRELTRRAADPARQDEVAPIGIDRLLSQYHDSRQDGG